MRLYPFIVAFAALSAGIYATSWLFKIMTWEGEHLLRIAAVVPFLIGLVLLIIYNVQLARKKEKDDFDKWLDED